MGHIPHEFFADEPPLDDEDTRPYEWAPTLQTPVSTHADREQARRILGDFNAARRSLSSTEHDRYFDAAFGIGGVSLLEEEPVEPDLQHTNWLSEGVRSFGRTVFRRCNDVAAWLERGA